CQILCGCNAALLMQKHKSAEHVRAFSGRGYKSCAGANGQPQRLANISDVVRGVITKMPFSPLCMDGSPYFSLSPVKKARSGCFGLLRQGAGDQWNCSSSVEPVKAFTLEEPPWIT